MNRPKQRGTAWETAIVSFLKEHGVRYAERRTLGGSQDRGDVAGIPGVVIEAKAEARVNLASWLSEAQTEAANDKADIGVVWSKRRGKTSPGDAYVIMDGNTLIKLLVAGGWIPARVDLPPDRGTPPSE